MTNTIKKNSVNCGCGCQTKRGYDYGNTPDNGEPYNGSGYADGTGDGYGMPIGRGNLDGTGKGYDELDAVEYAELTPR
jgi:hypothetical protein